jgi:hypothetical protein
MVQSMKKLSLQDLTHQNYECLRIESQKSRLDYIAEKAPPKKGGVQRNFTADLS